MFEIAIKVDKISEETKNETLVVKILSLTERETKSDRGEGVYHFGLMGDDSGTIPFTAWTMPASIRAGDVVELKNFTARKYNESLRVYIDAKTDVVLRPDDKIEVKRVYREYKIKDLSLKDVFVVVSGRIEDQLEKEYEKDGSTRNVTHSTLTDDTGSIRLSLFDRKLEDGSFYRIEGAKLSEYKGKYRLTAGEKTHIEKISEFATPDEKLYDICELSRPVDSISITGMVVFLGEKGGLVRRCSECRKTTEDVKCPDHPDADLFLDLYAYFTVEDGTGDIQCNAGRAPLMSVLGLTEEALDISKPKVSRADVMRNLREKLFSVPLLLHGDCTLGPNGPSFRVRKVEMVDEQRLKKIGENMQEEIL